ncbi:hypothetical protein [Enterococcus sp. DIV0876]|uniref:hypothetical protein n=1 Tax=Enterococcus sp. DIV0876 TaxID=2774633 RepID=UPI003D30170D
MAFKPKNHPIFLQVCYQKHSTHPNSLQMIAAAPSQNDWILLSATTSRKKLFLVSKVKSIGDCVQLVVAGGCVKAREKSIPV